jgi:hypothetical protein
MFIFIAIITIIIIIIIIIMYIDSLISLAYGSTTELSKIVPLIVSFRLIPIL